MSGWAHFWHIVSLGTLVASFVNGVAGHYGASALDLIASILAFRLARDIASGK
jgi:hypothetical protein